MNKLIAVCILICSGCLSETQAAKMTNTAADVSASLEDARQYYIASASAVLAFCAGVPSDNAAAAKFCAQVPSTAETLTAKINVLFTALRAFSLSTVDATDSTTKVINVPVTVSRDPMTESDGE